MKTAILLLALAIAPGILHAGGTKKKKRKFYIRRELVALGQMQPPLEYHNDSGTFHALICKTAGPQPCGWARPPLWRDREHSLAKIEQMVVRMMAWPRDASKGEGNEGWIALSTHLDIQWRRLPNGYEFAVEEGQSALADLTGLYERSKR